MSLKLFCLVFPDEDPSKHLFPVSLNATETVDDLKTAIKCETAPQLDHVAAAHELNLYKVSSSDDDNLTQVLSDLRFDGSDNSVQELRPRTRLSKVFPGG